MNAEPAALDRCPLCGQPLTDAPWLEEYRQFLVECPQCTTFTITPTLAARFRFVLVPDERRLVERLSRYLQQAGDDDDREVTEDSWVGLAAQADD